MKFYITQHVVDITIVIDIYGNPIEYHKDTKEKEIVIPIDIVTDTLMYIYINYYNSFFYRFNVKTMGSSCPVCDIKLFQKIELPQNYSIIKQPEKNVNDSIDEFREYTDEGYDSIPVITSLKFVKCLTDEKSKEIEELKPKFIKHLGNAVIYTKLINNNYNKYVLEDCMFDEFHCTPGITYEGSIINCDRSNDDYAILPINMIRHGKYIWSFKYLSGDSIFVGLTKSEFPYYQNHYIKSEMFWLYALKTSELFDLGEERMCAYYKPPKIGDEIHFYYNSFVSSVYIAINDEPFIEIFNIDRNINHLHPIVMFKNRGSVGYMSLFFSEYNSENVDFQYYPIKIDPRYEKISYNKNLKKQCDNVMFFDVNMNKGEIVDEVFRFNSQCYSHFVGGIDFFPTSNDTPEEALLSIYIN